MDGGRADISDSDLSGSAGGASDGGSASDARGQGEGEQMSLGQLAAATGVSGRTIRYYIGRGLLPRPASSGRGAHYGAHHEERLARIRSLKQEGYTLAEIGSMLASKGKSAVLTEPETYLSYRVAPDVVVMVQSDIAPWRHNRILDALAELVSRLGFSDAQ